MAERALATAFVNLVPGTSEIDKYFKQSLPKDAEDSGNEAGKKMGTGMGQSVLSSFKGLVGAIGLSMGVASVVNFFKDSAASLAQEQAGQVQTAAAIKSTGGAAQVTARQVEDLAQSLEAKTATDADAIRSGENLLLTFTNIKNGVGEGKDIFNQATQTAVDMSRALGQDVTQSAMQLGKALNDPVGGVTALRRVGVQLSADQQQQVKDFMAVGDAASAQKVILDELGKEFGGSGAAYADSYAGKLFAVSDAFDDMGKKFIASVEPALMALADILTTAVIPALGTVFGFISDNFAPIGAFVGVIGALTLAFNLQNIALAISTSAWWANAAAMLANPLTWIVVGIAAVVAALVWVATKTTFFQDTWKVMSGAISTAWNATVSFLSTAFTNVGNWFANMWKGMQTGWTSFSTWISGSIKAFGNFFAPVFSFISDVFRGYVNTWLTIFEGFINFAISGINGLLGAVNNVLSVISKATNGAVNFKVPSIPNVNLPKLAAGGYVDRPTTALIGEAGPEVVTPLKDFERMMGLTGNGGPSINYYAAPNESLSSEQQLVNAVQRAGVLAW